MYLCEEYYSRKNISVPLVKYVDKGFIFFEKNKLLKIQWDKLGNHPGSYSISECFLENNIKILKKYEVKWSEYEGFLKDWSREKTFILNKSDIFHLLWIHFVKRYELFLVENYDPIKIYETIKGDDCIHKSLELLEEISLDNKSIHDFWNNKVLEIYQNYCPWIANLK